jgi:hypothetical protein
VDVLFVFVFVLLLLLLLLLQISVFLLLSLLCYVFDNVIIPTFHFSYLTSNSRTVTTYVIIRRTNDILQNNFTNIRINF